MSSVEHVELKLEAFDQVAAQAINYYSTLAESEVILLNYSENATYLVSKPLTGEKYILRVGRPGYHSKSAIESEVSWLKEIDESACIKVSTPIPADNGEYVQTIKAGNCEHHCVVFNYLEGSAPNEDNEQELIRQFEVLGEMTARLHEYSITNQGKLKHFDRLTWDFDTIIGDTPKWAKWQDGMSITAERAELFQRVADTIKKRLDHFGKGPDRFGLIHADLRLANLLVHGDEIKVIDFDDSGFGWYLFDIAASLSFIEHYPYVTELIQSWIKGYRKVRHLSEVEEREIPTFIMMRRLQLIAWIGSRNNETTREMGGQYSVETDKLAENYLNQFEKNWS